MLSLSVPPLLASAEPAFFTADPATPTETAATSIATPTTSMNRESRCLLRIVLLPLPLTDVALLAGRLPAFANGSCEKTRAFPESSSLIDVSHSRRRQTHTSIRRAIVGSGGIAEEEEEVSATPPLGSRQAT
jgi:hypothetical protein